MFFADLVFVGLGDVLCAVVIVVVRVVVYGILIENNITNAIAIVIIVTVMVVIIVTIVTNTTNMANIP